MKEIAEIKKLPPVYSGKWATATDEEVQEELAKGIPYTYRFRVPKEVIQALTLLDSVMKVSWKLDTLGDFVIMRSNGQPVYNFCVTVDDATVAISHIIRAEEHLPNTLRQALVYKTLGFPMPFFAHVSLILAPDRSKLSKRHGATSVGQFREMGYLPQAMVNYLALLGWGATSVGQVVEKFSIGCVNKSGVIFYFTKLRWMNGQHLRALPFEELSKLIVERWKSIGLLTASEGPFIDEAVQLLKDEIDLVTDSDTSLSNLLSYPVRDTLSRPSEIEITDFKQYALSIFGVHWFSKLIVEDKLPEVSASLLAAYDSGELLGALEEGHAGRQKWVKGFGKTLKRKREITFHAPEGVINSKAPWP
ncbi:hypothetical protein CRYUN_Cryun04dG0084500 [Craigia yunnanensis]